MTPAQDATALANLPQPETMLTYASILEKPKYQIDEKTGARYLLATGEIVEAACAALRVCAALRATSQTPDAVREADIITGAMAIASSRGHDPDEPAPLTEMCTDENAPVPWWMVFTEEAEACLKAVILSTPSASAGPQDSTCYIERSKVREILTGQPDESLYITEDILREVDGLTIFTAADFQPSAGPQAEAWRGAHKPVYYRYRTKAHGGDWNVVLPKDLPTDKSSWEIEPLYNDAL